MRDFIRHHQIPVANFLFLLVSLYTIATGTKGPGEERMVKAVLSYVATPVQAYLTSARGYVRGLWDRYVGLVYVMDENRRLKEEIERLRLENAILKEEALATARLEEYLGFKRRSPLDLVAVRIIGRDPAGWSESVVIDKGRRDGVERGMGAITPDGVAGRVVEVYRGSAKVLLIVDPNSAVDVMVQRTRVRGIAKGMGDGLMRLLYIPKDADVRPGDVVITSGLSGIFPKGLPVGVVTEVSEGDKTFFKYVEMEPMVDTNRLEELLIVR